MSLTRLVDLPRIRSGLDALTKQDLRLAAIRERWGEPDYRVRPAGFASLIHVILGQQLSTSAARAMWERLTRTLDPVEPGAFQQLSDDELRACGFSRQKIGYARGLAEAIQDGRFDPHAIAEMDRESAAAEIRKLKGFGRWSAEMYQIFSLADPDVWPVGDLAVSDAVHVLVEAEDKLSIDALDAVGEAWRPHRTAAALLLWQDYVSRKASAGRSG